MQQQKSLKVSEETHDRIMSLRGKLSVDGVVKMLLDEHDKKKKK